MNIKVTVEYVWEVEDLAHYHASSLEEAVQLTKAQLDAGELDLEALPSFGSAEVLKVEGVE